VDYYASLGVSRTSEDVVIRAAYLALMRRYHPDTNPSPEAADRVRDIAKAYAVLGDHDKRREYDSEWAPHEASEFSGFKRKPPPVGPMAFGVTLLCVTGLIWIIWAQQPVGDRLPKLAETASNRVRPIGSHPSVDCSSPTVTKLVRRELMLQAGEIRGTDQSAFARLTEQMSVKTTSLPSIADEPHGTIGCQVAITVNLPAGLSYSDGSSTLTGHGDYVVEVEGGAEGPAARFIPDSRFLTELASVDAVLPPRDERSLQEQRVAAIPVIGAELAVRPPRKSATPAPHKMSKVEIRTKPASDKTPSPRKSDAPVCRGDRWTALICGDPNLTALDQQLSAFEQQSRAHADAKKNDRLEQSRTRFEKDRVACRTEACARRALVTRTTEVAEIMRNRT
jgi:curved DNA-binding protein CbpA